MEFKYVTPNPEVPEHYFCSVCKAKGCKLWRYGASSHIELKCFRCAAEASTIEVDSDGKTVSKFYASGTVKTDQVNNHVPAVPVDDTYWGYTSVPEDGVKWWRALRSEP